MTTADILFIIIREGEKDLGEDSVLSEKLLESGYECCSSPESVRKLLSGINVTEKDVAVALGCMARSYTNMSGVGDGSDMDESNWNVENFVAVVIDVVSYKVSGSEMGRDQSCNLFI